MASSSYFWPCAVYSFPVKGSVRPSLRSMMFSGCESVKQRGVTPSTPAASDPVTPSLSRTAYHSGERCGNLSF
jgi:hypothetical protein